MVETRWRIEGDVLLALKQSRRENVRGDVFVDLTTFGYCPKTNQKDDFLAVSYKVLYSNQRHIIFSSSRLGVHNFKGN